MSLFKKIFTSAVVMTTIVWSVGLTSLVPTAQAAGSYPAGSLLAMQNQKDAAVYIVMDNGTKKVFPSPKEYFTWYTNFDKVIRVPVTELDKYPDGGAVPVRAGTKLITHMNTARIYAVEPNGVIRWIPTPAIAVALYGANWASRVVDLIPGFFSATYTVGADLSTTYPTGTLVKMGATTYYIDGTTKRPFAGTGFADNNFSTANVITVTDLSAYTDGTSITGRESALAGLTSTPAPTPGTTGGVTIALASDTPASGMVVKNAARVPFTKIMVTTGSAAATIDTLVVKRGGIGQDGSFSSVDVLDANTMLPFDVNSKTFNSLHEATFTKDIVIPANTTKYLILAGNMGDTTNYAGEAPALGVSAITMTGGGSVSGTLPIFGNTMTINSSITIGSATVSRGSYSNATTTALEVGRLGYTFLSFQIQAGSAEDVTVRQLAVYQAGTATVNTDLTNWQLYRDGTKLVDGAMDANNTKYVDFVLSSPITIPKGQTYQFQIKADVAGGSARTVQLGFYRTTDLLVKGETYGFNITPTYSGTGSSASNPVLDDNQATISNGTLTVERSNTVTATNITVGNNQTLGAFKFTVKGEPIDVTALTLAVTSSSTGTIEDALQSVKLVDANGVTLAGPTDVTNNSTNVAFTDTFTLPVGVTDVKVVANLANNGGWATNDTIYVSINTPATKITATGESTGNAITSSTTSKVDTNTQTIKAAYLAVTRNTLPASATTIKGAQNLLLGSWNFDATNSGEDLRITSLVFAASSSDAVNLTVYNGVYGSGGVAMSPINDAPTAGDNQSSTFAFDSPIVITKGTTKTIQLVGNINSNANTNQSAQFGLTDSAATSNASVVAYGVGTGNRATLALTADNGAVFTYSAGGAVTISTYNNPANALVRAGATGVTFGYIKLDAQYEPADVTVLKVFVANGAITGTATGEYRDVTQVYVYDGTKQIAAGTIPSTDLVTFNFDRGALTIPQDGSKILTIKADIGTINQNLDNSPATPDASVAFGIGGTDGITEVGNSSNATITTETYNGSTTSAMALHKAIPTVTYSQAGSTLGASAAMVNGASDLFAFKVAADANGSEVLLYRTSFIIATGGGADTSVTACFLKDADGNTVGASVTPTTMLTTGANLNYVSYVFDNPSISAGNTKEALMISPGNSMTYKLNCTVANAGTGDNISVSILGDTASSTPAASQGTPAAAGQNLADAWSVLNQGDFVWSDNYKNRGLATDNANATAWGQWYNGYLVPGLGANATGSAYTIGWSS